MRIELEKDINTIISRNLIFPDDASELLKLIRDGELDVDPVTGTIVLNRITDEGRNLMFPEDEARVNAILADVNRGIEMILPKEVTKTKEIIQKVNEGDTKFKFLVKTLIATIRDDHPREDNGKVVDELAYDNVSEQTYDGKKATVSLQNSSVESNKVIAYQLKHKVNRSDMIRQVCELSEYMENLEKGYGLRIYFDDSNLHRGKQFEVVKGKDSEAQEGGDAVSDCAERSTGRWKEVLSGQNSGYVFYKILRTASRLPNVHVCKVKFEDSKKSLDSSWVNQHAAATGIIGLDQPKEDEDQGGIGDFFANLFGGFGIQSGGANRDRVRYEQMKARYAYERDSLLNNLMK